MNNSLVVTSSSNNPEFNKNFNFEKFLERITITMFKLPKRILYSFLPPLNYNKQYLFTDFLGPLLSNILLISLLQYGLSCKKFHPYNINTVTVICTVLTYYILLSSFVFIITRSFVRIRLKIFEIFTLIGYSFYGCILSLLFPFGLTILPDYIFYTSLIFFGGLSCVRVLLILLFIIEMPVIRLLICSIIGNIQILFVIYLYYCYIHPTHVFRAVQY